MSNIDNNFVTNLRIHKIDDSEDTVVEKNIHKSKFRGKFKKLSFYILLSLLIIFFLYEFVNYSIGKSLFSDFFKGVSNAYDRFNKSEIGYY